MSRLPIRLRLTLAFAAAMALVLGAVGAFLYVRLGVALEEQLDETLQVRADALTPLVQERDGRIAGGGAGARDDETVVQVLRPDGTVLGALPTSAAAPLTSAAELERARDGSAFLERESLPMLAGEPARLLVRPVVDDGETLFLVVGASLEDRAEALAGLLAQLLVAGPLALLLATGAGYLLAGAALGPVEAMRRRAEDVSSERTGQRLPLPAARDEIHRLGETLNAMLERLEAGIARERRFVADASHELRTPLALLRTELELALRRPRPLEELEQALASALEEVDRVTRLAENLLVLARSDDGRLPLRRAPLAASDLLEAVARRFAARAAAEGRGIEVSESANGSVVADRLRLEQALGNLVDNALRHGTGTVRLEARRSDGQLELSVSDEGGGFPLSFLPHAFERFARADEARGGGSTGLGLAIVQAIARAHDGTAQAANGPSGSGAVVSMTLPVSRT
jgi:heavy metal sensor kinase